MPGKGLHTEWFGERPSWSWRSRVLRVTFTFAQGWATRPIGGASMGPNRQRDLASIWGPARTSSAPFPIGRRDPGFSSAIS